MKLSQALIVLFILPAAIVLAGKDKQGYDKTVFYAVMATGKIGDIDLQLSALEGSEIPEKKAYEGALLMRKAGYATRPKDKLKLFKSGYILLESSLARDSSNGEYHFLRLIIQEHAPGIVNYRRDIERDSQAVYNSYKNLPEVVQKAIVRYSKKSKILQSKYLNG